MSTTAIKRPIRIPLSLRFLAFAILILLINGLIMSVRSDHIMEEAFLNEANQHIALLVKRIARDIEVGRIPPSDSALKGEMIAVNSSQSRIQMLSLYLFDQEGRIVAHSAGERKRKPISGPYARVINQRAPSLGEKRAWDEHHKTVKADYLLPARLADGREVGLEAEVNLTEIEQSIKLFDGPFEQSMWYSILFSSLLMFLLLGSLVHLRLTGPVQHLHRVIRRLTGGELESRTEIHQRDEIGELGDGINQLAQSVQDLLLAQEEAYMETLRSLAQALEMKDPYTAEHSGRVSRYAVRLGQHVGLGREDLSLLKRGAMMHDLGKIGIPDAVLNKPAALDDKEYELIQRHPIMTASIMRPLSRFRAFADIAAWHHERWDGNGYPDGLQGDEIPLLARIVGIADTWDAMTGDRVYRKGMSHEKAINILESEQDQGQFDPALIRTFIAMIRQDISQHKNTTTAAPDSIDA